MGFAAQKMIVKNTQAGALSKQTLCVPRKGLRFSPRFLFFPILIREEVHLC